jgi:hypothetical protein
MWKYHQAWFELHETYVELHKALINADANAWAKLDQAKRAQVDLLCLVWRQTMYSTEMTEALAEVQAKRDQAKWVQAKRVQALLSQAKRVQALLSQADDYSSSSSSC